jgi:uncharacterized membrane protein YeiB
MMLEILIFVLFQSMAINGLVLSMEDGMILNGYKRWLKSRKNWFSHPMGLCIRCSASVFGTITFWPAALLGFGWKPIEVFAWIMDIFVLVYLNSFLYKRV